MALNCFLTHPLLLLLVSIATPTVSVECYQCNSQLQEGCDVHPLEVYSKECKIKVPKSHCLLNTTGLSIDSECHGVRERCKGHFGQSCDTLTEEIPIESTFCRKSVTSVYSMFQSKRGNVTTEHEKVTPVVTRGCGYIKDETGFVCISKGNGGSFQISCSCKGNGCNEAPSSLQRLHFLFLLLISSAPLLFSITSCL